RLLPVAREVVAVAEADEHLPVRHRRRAPRRQVHRRLPQFLATLRVEANHDRLVVTVADAAAGKHPAADHRRGAVDVDLGVLPFLLAGGGVEAVDAVVAGAKVDAADDDVRARLGVAGGGELPDLLAGVGLQAVELAALVLVVTLADVDAAVGDGR